MEKKAVSGVMLRLFLIIMLSGAFGLLPAKTEFETVEFWSYVGEIHAASGSSNSWVWVRDTITGAWGEAVVGTGDAIYVARKSSFYRYLPADNSWTVLAAPPNPDAGDAFKTGTALAWDFGDYIYALYGAATADSRRWFYQYSISGNSWQALTNTPYDQGEGDTITWVGLDNSIYAAIGGEQRATYFLRYDPSTNTWSDAEVADPPAGMGDGASLVWAGGELLYALRGEFHEESATYDFWGYNVTSDVWTAMADIPALAHDGGVGGVGDGGSLLYIGLWLSNQTDFIYALSGNQAYPESPTPIPDNRSFRYTISTDSWERLADLPFGIGYYVGCRLGYADGHIYAWQGAPSTWTGSGDDLARYEFAPLPRTWTVDDDGPADFSKIQDAINAANPRDTIYVYNGTYYENVVANKTVSLVGENKENTIIDAQGVGNALSVSASNVAISNFTIKHAGDEGVVLHGSAMVRNNIIIDNRFPGIQGWVSGNIIEENLISNNWIGVQFLSEGNIVRRNILENNANYGVDLYAGNNTIQDNEILHHPAEGISLYHSSNNRITRNLMSHNGFGIRAKTCIGNNITENTFINNGLLFEGGNSNKIYHNNFINSKPTMSISFNTWDDDYPSGGNYWSDYTGVDVKSGPAQDQPGSDGIGDTPYVIGADNRDRYPLMYQWPDMTPPTTTDDYDKAWHVADFTITLVATDVGQGVAETYYKINVGSIQNVSTHGQPSITTEGANNKLEYWSADKAGNEELPHKILTGIKLDKTAPLGYILVNNDDANTTTLTVTLNLSASDATSGVSQMRFSNDGATWTTWELYTTSKSWNLSPPEGTKTVHVQYKDNAGCSSTYQDTISLLDVTHPLTTISLGGVEGNNGWFTSDVTVTFSATDDISGVDKIEYSFDNTTWITYATSFTITNEGNTTIYYKSTDKAGNPETIRTETIKIDKTAPAGTIIINNGDAYTTSTSVTLTLTSTDDTSGVRQVRFSNDGVWDTEPWESPLPTKTWTVAYGDGTKTVYIQYVDDAGLVSQSYFDTITLDTAPPAIIITSPSSGYEIKSSTITAIWTGSDGTSGISHYEIKLDDHSWINVEMNTTHIFTELEEGNHTIRVKAIDNAGLTKQGSVDFIVDTSPLLEPSYTEVAAILATTIIVAIGTALYFFKIRKR